MNKSIRFVLLTVMLLSFVISSGCAVMGGAPSLTFLSQDLNEKSPNVKVLGPKDKESDIQTWFLLLFWVGPMVPSHEAPANRLLDKYKADVLLDADMSVTSFGIPYIFMQTRYTVEGIPAKFVKGGAK